MHGKNANRKWLEKGTLRIAIHAKNRHRAERRLCAKVDCIATYLSSLVSRFFNNYNSIGSFASLYCLALKSIFGVFLASVRFSPSFSCFFFICLRFMNATKRVTKSIRRESYKFFCPYLHLQNYISFSLSVSQSTNSKR